MIPLSYGLIKIWREHYRLFIQKDSNGAISVRKELQLSKPPKITNELIKIRKYYENADKKYSQKRYSIHRHLKATYFIIVMFLVQETFLLIYKNFPRKYYVEFRGIIVFGWTSLGILLFGVYL